MNPKSLAIHGRMLTDAKYAVLHKLLRQFKWEDVDPIMTLLNTLREDDWVSESSISASISKSSDNG